MWLNKWTIIWALLAIQLGYGQVVIRDTVYVVEKVKVYDTIYISAIKPINIEVNFDTKISTLTYKNDSIFKQYIALDSIKINRKGKLKALNEKSQSYKVGLSIDQLNYTLNNFRSTSSLLCMWFEIQKPIHKKLNITYGLTLGKSPKISSRENTLTDFGTTTYPIETYKISLPIQLSYHNRKLYLYSGIDFSILKVNYQEVFIPFDGFEKEIINDYTSYIANANTKVGLGYDIFKRVFLGIEYYIMWNAGQISKDNLVKSQTSFSFENNGKQNLIIKLGYNF